MLITIIILVLSAVFFVNGKIRSDLVALCALVALLIFQILTPDEALSGFSNSVVIMMVVPLRNGILCLSCIPVIRRQYSNFPDRTCQNDQFTHSEISG